MMRFGLLPILLLACGKDDENGKETGQVDTEQHDSSEDSAEDSADPAEYLALSPAELVVAVGAQWQMQASVDSEEVVASYVSSDPLVLEVSSSGLARAESAGQATVQASWEGHEGEAQVTVQEDGTLQIRVFAEQTGEALAESRVIVNGETSTTDAYGLVSIAHSGSDPVDITVYAGTPNTYIPALFMDVLPRDLSLPLRLRGADDPGKAELSGAVDLSGTLMSGPEEKDAGLVTIGLAVPSFQQGALFFSLEHLFSANRTLSVEGIDVEMPGNFFVRDYGETWQGTSQEGPVSVWAFGGPVPKSGLASGINGVGESLAFLVPHFDAFTWTWVTDLQASKDTELQVDLLPDLSFDERIEVRMGTFPDGIPAETNALLMALSGDGEGGPVLTGMGQGKETMYLSRIRPEHVDGEQGFVLAIAQVGGFGSLGPQSLALVPIEEGVAEVTSWQALASIDSFDRGSMAFELASDATADFSRLQIRSASGTRRDVYLPPGAHSRVLPTDGPAMGYGSTTWTLVSVDTLGQSYEALLSSGGLDPESLTKSARTTARTVAQFLPAQ